MTCPICLESLSHTHTLPLAFPLAAPVLSPPMSQIPDSVHGVLTLDGHVVNVDRSRKTLTPIDTEGDHFYGLARGSNGSGPTMRRHMVELKGFTWRMSHNGIAHGPQLLASGEAKWVNPWD